LASGFYEATEFTIRLCGERTLIRILVLFTQDPLKIKVIHCFKWAFLSAECIIYNNHKTAKGNTLTSRQFVELKFLTGSNWDRSLGRQQSLKYGFQTGLSRRIHHNKLTNKNHKKWQKGMD